MGFCSTRRLMVGIGALWLLVLIFLWFPELVPLPGRLKWKKMGPDIGILRAEAFQKLRYNKTELNDTVHVCITSDKNTLGGMVALINSIDLNSKHPVKFHLVVDRESVEHLKTWIEKTRLHDIMYEVKGFPEEWVAHKIKVRGGRPELGSPLNYARYYLPKLFPDLKRIVFIDDDAIVQGDIKELYDVKLDSKHWAAFSDDCTGSAKRLTLMQNIYSEYIDFKNKHVLHLDISPMSCSFNVGVYVTDLDLWRKNNITEKLEYWMELNTKEEVYGNEKGGGGSQPPMMLVFHGKYTQMDPGWHIRYLGWTTGTSYTKEFVKHAKLLHWNGHFKPWGPRSQHAYVWDKYFLTDPEGEFVPVRRN